MKKKVFIICVVFAMMISCKNYAIGKDVKSLEQDLKEQVKGFLDTRKEELTEGIKNLGSEASSKVEEGLMQADAPQGQAEKQVVQGVGEDSKLKEEIEKEIKELKDKIEKSSEKPSLKAYLKYEEEVKKIKNKLTDKEKFEKELKDLEESFKKKKDDRKKVLEEAKRKLEEYKRKLEEYKRKVGPSTGKDTEKVKEQGKIGLEAFKYAKGFGVNGSYSVDDGTDSDDFAKKVIDDALKNIDEELKNTIEDTKE
ncbi:hypothetical protein [Borreliella tanukii]|uniref:hypothetical protein n=1 Tax=Borreliella tanukii TaxID=56146 RepID=UPI003CC915AD